MSYMRSEVLTAVKMSMLVFWVITPCRLVYGGSMFLRQSGIYCTSPHGVINQKTNINTKNGPTVSNIAVFLVVAPCSLVEVYRRLRGACRLHHQGDSWQPSRLSAADDGGSKHLWIVCKILPDYMAQQPRRQPSSYSPPPEPQITLTTIGTLSRIWGSHGGEYEDCCLLGFSTV
jgi:hypothetical protein